MNREVYIYTLSYNDDIRYVGRTFNVNKRLKEHIRESLYIKNKGKYHSHKSNWIRKVKNINIEVIDICDENNYSFWEQHYISLYNTDNNLIKCWDFAKECADFYNISRGNISTFSKNNTNVDLSGRGKYRILSGFIFKYH